MESHEIMRRAIARVGAKAVASDIYNLGDILGDHVEPFKLSFLENALTSNPVLHKLAAVHRQDVYGVIRMAELGSAEGIELEGRFGNEELSEMLSVMKKLLRVRDVVLRVNEEYIRSAGQQDEFRTEPAFRLQGSYRNMNRMAAKVEAVMNDRELETMIYSEYENEAQTLTTGAKEGDPASLAVAQLAGVGQGLTDIRDLIKEGVRAEKPSAIQTGLTDDTLGRLEKMLAGMKPPSRLCPHGTRRLPRHGPLAFLKRRLRGLLHGQGDGVAGAVGGAAGDCPGPFRQRPGQGGVGSGRADVLAVGEPVQGLGGCGLGAQGDRLLVR